MAFHTNPTIHQPSIPQYTNWWQKCACFCWKWCIVGFRTGALWVLWLCIIHNNHPICVIFYNKTIIIYCEIYVASWAVIQSYHTSSHLITSYHITYHILLNHIKAQHITSHTIIFHYIFYHITYYPFISHHIKSYPMTSHSITSHPFR